MVSYNDAMSVTIRRAVASDLDVIKRIAIEAKMFEPDDVGFFDGMLGAFLDGSAPDDEWLVVDDGGTVGAAAYYAPEPFADRMWNLYFIAVDPRQQGNGIGGALLAHVEDRLRERGSEHARVLIVETSSTDQYARTRDFYRVNGYDEEARIRQFYGPHDDKVVFWKSLAT